VNLLEYKFSVIIPIHFSISELQLKESFDSVVVDQILLPSELILVVDGIIQPSKLEFINLYSSLLSIPVKLFFTGSSPKGPGYARNLGVKNSTFDLVAFMDSDDVSLPDRFLKQIPLLKESCYDLIGGQIQELDETLTKNISIRSVPLNNQDIYKEFKIRNPINNVTVVIKKNIFLELGGYPELFFGEDYVLWVKMAERNCKMINIDSVLVKVRTGEGFLNRRFGIDYFKKNLKLSYYLMKFRTVGLRYSILRMLKFIFIFILPKKTQYFFVKKFTRNLNN
jgi:glycosyltransferase involved in cell wall biosynthesis